MGRWEWWECLGNPPGTPRRMDPWTMDGNRERGRGPRAAWAVAFKVEWRRTGAKIDDDLQMVCGFRVPDLNFVCQLAGRQDLIS